MIIMKEGIHIAVAVTTSQQRWKKIQAQSTQPCAQKRPFCFKSPFRLPRACLGKSSFRSRNQDDRFRTWSQRKWEKGKTSSRTLNERLP